MSRYITVFAFILILCGGFRAIAASIQSTTTGGAWDAPGTWVGGAVPTAADDVWIVSGSTVTFPTSRSCQHLRLEGTLTFTTDNMTLSVGGDFTLAGTYAITGNSSVRNLTTTGNLLIESGASGSISGINLTITGTSNLQGTVIFNSATGTKTLLGNVTVGNGGAVDFTAGVTLILAGTIEMSGTSSIGGTSTATGTLIGVNSFTVNTGATATLGRVALAVVGLTQINGTTVFNNSTGTKSFIGGMTIDNASVDFTAAPTLSINNVLTINNASSIGAASTATATINSTSTLLVSTGAVATIGRINLNIGSISAINGTTVFSNATGTKTCTGNVTVGSAGAITFSSSATLNVGADLITTPGAVLGNTGTTGTISVSGNFAPVTGGATMLQGLTLNVTGNIIIPGTASVNAGTGTNVITVRGNWNVTSSQPDAFVEGTSSVSFLSTTSLQSITTTEATGETFYTLIVNNTSGLTPGVSTSVPIRARNITITNGNVEMNGFDLTITGNATASTDNFTGGTIYSSLTGTDILITDPSNNKSVQLDGTTWGTSAQPFGIAVTASHIEFEGSDFFALGTGVFTKTGSGDDRCEGGSVFTGNFILNQNNGRWVLAETDPDIFMNDVTFNNNTPDLIFLTYSSTGNEFRGTTILNANSSGGILVGRNNGPVGTRTVLFSNLVINQSSSGDITIGQSDATRNTIVTIEGEISITSAAGSNGSISFGSPAYGSVILTATARFNIALGTVLGSNNIILQRLTQNGSVLAQNIALSGTAMLLLGNSNTGDGCTFSALATFRASEVRLRYNTFHGVSSFTQTGSGGNNSAMGGNTFNAAATFNNVGTRQMRLGIDAADDFNSDAYFIRTGGAIDPTLIYNSTFAGNISTTGSTSAITFGASGGRVTMDGGAVKQLNADVGFPPVINRLTMNGGSLTLNTPVTIPTDLNLTTGVIYTTSTNLLTLNAGSSLSGTPSNTSHIDGPVRKTGNTSFTFPTGDNGIYRGIGISAPTNAAHYFTAEFFRSSHPNATGPVASSIVSVTSCEYWNLAQSPGGSSVSVTISWVTADCTPPPYINDPAGLVVARWNNTSWQNEGGIPAGNAATGSVTSTAAVTSFGAFALASTVLSNPLPIQLLSFTAIMNAQIVNLEWTTATEQNNNYFTIERSKKGDEFESIAQVAGAPNGNSTRPIDYTYFDRSPYEGISYYRLKQTDFDNRSTFSKIVKVNNDILKRLFLYPNPAKPQTLVTTNITGDFLIFNAAGKMIMQVNNTNKLDVSSFAPGVYLIRNSLGVSAKLIVE